MNLDEYIQADKERPNVWCELSSGELLNLLEEAIERMGKTERQMTRDEKIGLLICAVQRYLALSAEFDRLGDLIDPNSTLYEAVWRTFDVMVNAMSVAIGDKNEWLAWYIFENDCGRKGYSAGYGNDLKPVTSILGLLEIIEDPREGHTRSGA